HQARSTSQDNKHYITLQLSQLYDGVETKLSSLPEVNHVYMSQSKEYVIEFEKGADPFDINLLHFCYQQGWHYRQLVNGHTLENQIFNKES
ncbi:MAG: hypothetical protein R3254_11085, partial [Thiomicrorhabdus sp.]|nr:hypothetical protein [Thiomicrorhabdus sp.]